MKNRTKVISIFIPHEGCPHDCVFCNQKKISGSIKSPSIEEIRDIIEASLLTIDRSKYSIILAFYGGSFTAIPQTKQKMYLEIAREYKHNNKIQYIRLSTRPDYMDENQVNLLKEYKVDHVELGIQSTNPAVLNCAKRYYSMKDIQIAVKNLMRVQIDYGFQIMPGLPKDTKDKFIKTCIDLLPLKPSTLRIYPTVVIEGTEMKEMFDEGLYKPLSLEEAVEWTMIGYILFKQVGTDIIRMGLHASESLLYEDNMIAGPFHSAFGEMVESRIYWYMLKELVEEHDLQNIQIHIKANPKDFSKISGNKGENRKKLENEYNIKYKFLEDRSLIEDIIIEHEDKSYFLNKKEFCDKMYSWIKCII
ncbi:radical SAM family protein [Alkalibaculum bacchi]|uniref:Radical SAM family protein n=1 Tax=Alkalibaculum bacchi TaxID=645887 RepID=A0A366IBX4_9FIRM|nr:radical SAM protein [Alkalibaculum bacchi]RBP68276.1 radical SAM family protein [Alkalibaculum bacchi]